MERLPDMTDDQLRRGLAKAGTRMRDVPMSIMEAMQADMRADIEPKLTAIPKSGRLPRKARRALQRAATKPAIEDVPVGVMLARHKRLKRGLMA